MCPCWVFSTIDNYNFECSENYTRTNHAYTKI